MWSLEFGGRRRCPIPTTAALKPLEVHTEFLNQLAIAPELLKVTKSYKI